MDGSGSYLIGWYWMVSDGQTPLKVEWRGTQAGRNCIGGLELSKHMKSDPGLIEFLWKIWGKLGKTEICVNPSN